MASHLRAWEEENKHTTWRGPYSIGRMQEYLEPGARVLDVGCGNGKLLLPLIRAGFDVSGVDVSGNALKGLAAHRVMRGDARHLPCKTERFDAVVCHDVLQHLLSGERYDAVDEAMRVLKPGGMFFIEVFGREDMRYGGTPVEPDTFLRQSGIIYHYFTEEELRSLLAGFTVLRVESIVSHKNFRGKEYMRHKIAVVAKK